MMPVAILCGGKGTRLAPLTDHLPKSLVDVCGQPFIAHQLELLCRNGYTDIVLLIGHLGKQIMDAVGDGSAFGVRVRYSDDGAGVTERDDAIWQSPAWTEAEMCFVIYGDSYLDCDYAKLERGFRASGCEILETVHNGVGYGVRAFRHHPIYAGVALTIDMAQPFEEIGSRHGLARVRAILERQALCRH